MNWQILVAATACIRVVSCTDIVHAALNPKKSMANLKPEKVSNSLSEWALPTAPSLDQDIDLAVSARRLRPAKAA